MYQIYKAPVQDYVVMSKSWSRKPDWSNMHPCFCHAAGEHARILKRLGLDSKVWSLL